MHVDEETDYDVDVPLTFRRKRKKCNRVEVSEAKKAKVVYDKATEKNTTAVEATHAEEKMDEKETITGFVSFFLEEKGQDARERGNIAPDITAQLKAYLVHRIPLGSSHRPGGPQHCSQ